MNLLQGEFARTTDYGARWHRWRTAALLAGGLLVAHVAAAGLQDSSGQSRDQGARRGNRADFFSDHAHRDAAGSAAPDAIAARPHPPFRSQDREYFLRTLEALSGAVSATPRTKIDALSYREQSLDMKGHGTEPCGAFAAVPAGGQTGSAARKSSPPTPVDAGVEAQMQVRAPRRQGATMTPIFCKLKAWYAGLQERERRVVLIGFGGACCLDTGGRNPAAAAVGRVGGREADRDPPRGFGVDATRTPRRSASAGTAQFNDTGEAPVVVVDRVGRETGLGTALRGTQPSGNGVRVQLEAAPFDTLVTWIATLDQRYGLSIDSITRRSGGPSGSGQCQRHLRRDAALRRNSRPRGRPTRPLPLAPARADRRRGGARRRRRRAARLHDHALSPARRCSAEDFSGSVWHGSAGRIIANGRAGRSARMARCTRSPSLRSASSSRTCIGSRADSCWMARPMLDRAGISPHRDFQGGGPMEDLRDFGRRDGLARHAPG